MAIEANTHQTYATKGIREDLKDIITRITPTEFPFMSMIGSESVSNSLVEWQTQALRAPAVNAQVEGDVFTPSARTATAKLSNYTQTLTAAISVSGTNEAVKAAGRASEIGYQVSLAALELKGDMEAALCSSANGVAGAASNATVSATHAGGAGAARFLRGMEGWLADNVDLGATGVAPVYTTGAWTAPVDGTPRALTEAMFLNVSQKSYDAGGNPDTAILSSKQRLALNAFNGGATKFLSMSDNELHNTFDVYVSPFGKYKLVTSRIVRNSVIPIIDRSKWKMGVLRPYQAIDLPKSHDATRKALLTEVTLFCLAPNSSGAVKALS